MWIFRFISLALRNLFKMTLNVQFIVSCTQGGHRRTGSTSVQQTFRVKTLHKHSGFTMQNLKHDIAVLQLERHAQLSGKVNTVCLPDQDADLNSICYITGWNEQKLQVLFSFFRTLKV